MSLQDFFGFLSAFIYQETAIGIYPNFIANTILNALPILTSLIFTTAFWYSIFAFPVSDKASEAWTSEITCPRSCS